MNYKRNVVVTGGGAAGFFAAIHAAMTGAAVTVLEKSNKVLSKVKISGGGRCNVTNSLSDPRLLIQNYPRGSKELLGPLTRFGTVDTIQWFESRNVRLKAEADGRVFPVTDNSQTIIDCLVGEAKRLGVTVRLQSPVASLKRLPDRFEIGLAGGHLLYADKLIVASGGSPSVAGFDWLQQLGHSIIPPVPSLFTFNVPDNPFAELMGVSVQKATVKIRNTRLEQTGPVLFTHWGLSGPAVLRLSAFAARLLHERNYEFETVINFCPDLNEQELFSRMQEIRQQQPLKKIIVNPFSFLPNRLWETLCMMSSVTGAMRWSEAGNKTLQKLVHNCLFSVVTVKGKTTFKEEFVTCGGISLKEIDMKTMQSKIIPGLYFAGEVLDIDGITGGFNFQATWTTGYIAGVSAATGDS